MLATYRHFRVVLLATAAIAVILLQGCGGSKGGTTGPPPIVLSVSLSSSTIVLPQDGTAVQIPVTINAPTETASFSITGLPPGVTENYKESESNPSGQLTLTAASATPSGTFSGTITVGSSGQTASTGFTLVVAIVAKVSSAVDTTLGINGKLQQFMATSFQVAEFQPDFFSTGSAAREAALTALGPQHIRLQPLSQGVPMQANTGAATDWNFTVLDEIVQPVLATADHSPEFQVAVAPSWMNDANGHLEISTHLADFAAYSANLVRYYNKGGFDYAGQHFQSASTHPITWWGIFNEYNLNGLTAAQYVQLYNAVVPAMLAVDPTIKFSALEFSDFGLSTGDAGDPMLNLPTFVAAKDSGGVNAQVDIVSTHFYSSCNQTDPDTALFNSVPGFADNLRYFYQQLKTRPDLANVPVWVTENNVNADFDNNGMSNCNPGQVFVTDKRGTSAFFAAWRPYVFAQLGKAGNQALYHWDYDADQQYGEVDGSSGNTYLSYWVDKTLASIYPYTAATPGQDILTLTSTDTSTIETLATKNSDGSIAIMLANHAVNAAADNNGAGAPRTIMLDISSLGNFTSGSQLVLDANTSATIGPAPTTLSLQPVIQLTLNGYGTTFLTLKP